MVWLGRVYSRHTHILRKTLLEMLIMIVTQHTRINKHRHIASDEHIFCRFKEGADSVVARQHLDRWECVCVCDGAQLHANTQVLCIV